MARQRVAASRLRADHRRSPHDRERVPTAAELFVPGRPTFALVHLVLPHAPSEPPAPYRGLYTQENRDVSSIALRSLSAPGAPDVSASEMSRIAREPVVCSSVGRVGPMRRGE